MACSPAQPDARATRIQSQYVGLIYPRLERGPLVRRAGPKHAARSGNPSIWSDNLARARALRRAEMLVVVAF